MAGFVVGLTGGVASGKSEVTRRFEALGVVVADADVASREAVAIGSPGLAEVVSAFGPDALAADGSLDRPRMRRLVFADADARRRLETIVHPRVRVLLHEACVEAHGAYAIAAIPLLAEVGRAAYPWLDRILVIDVPVAVQHARLLLRDGIDARLADGMITAQATREARLALADDVLANDGGLADLDAMVRRLDASYRSLAATR